MEESIKELFDLSGQTAIVSGGAMGIGEGIARRLSEAGCNLVIADTNLEQAQKTASGLPGDAVAIMTDISREEDVASMIEKAVSEFGGVDIMVNNAGIYPMKPTLEVSVSEWDRIMGINLKGTFFCSRESAKKMIERGRGGRIINIASIDSVHPSFPGLLAYDSSKGGMLMLTKSLALELAPHKILVNAIAPGAIATPGATRGVSEEVTKVFTDRIPLKRMGEPDDIGSVALFLASGASAYMTGSFIVVDGGILLA